MNHHVKTLSILSRHASLKSAVLAAGIDLSYNEASALEDIARLEKGSNGSIKLAPVTEAYVVTENDRQVVYYVLNCDLPLLNKFVPFHACLHDGKFSAATIFGDEIRITEGLSANRNVIREIIAAGNSTDRNLLAHKA